MYKLKRPIAAVLTAVFLPLLAALPATAQQSRPQQNPSADGIGMQGRLQQPPPGDAPTISLPSNGQVFEELPITITGLCTDTLLVRVFKNSVFAGSAICDGGSYSIQTDLFPGNNELSARQYDDLDQASPESNKVTVSYPIDVPLIPGSPDDVAQRITLTTTFARRGADPGQDMTWPLTLSGGRGPYALKVEWGDSKEDLLTQNTPGTFDIKHAYERPGVYKIIVKATDADGESAFMQVVGIGNGSISTAGAEEDGGTAVTRTRVLWQPALIMFPLIISSFWLGKRYQLKRVRYRMKNRIIPIDK
ncbi:MAG: PKD domain-containing protein [Candidatus Saccharimonadales bacterium]